MSFLSIVCFVSKKNKNGTQWFPKKIVPLEQNNPALWNDTKSQYASLFYEIMEDFHRRKKMIQIYLSKKIPEEYYWNPYTKYLLFYKIIEQYNLTRSNTVLSQLLYSDQSVEEWSLVFRKKRNISLGTWDSPIILPETITSKLITYCAWSRPYAKENPDITALTAAVVVLDGYRFDFETGDYQLNDIGKMGVEFVAEFPNPQTAFFLRTIRNGGNQDYIDGLLKKFGNRVTWEELFKTAKPPEK